MAKEGFDLPADHNYTCFANPSPMFRSMYLNNRLFIAVGLCVFLFLMGFAYPVVLALAKIGVLVLVVMVAVDVLMLYQTKQGIRGNRDCAEKLSNGDENP